MALFARRAPFAWLREKRRLFGRSREAFQEVRLQTDAEGLGMRAVSESEGVRNLSFFADKSNSDGAEWVEASLLGDVVTEEEEAENGFSKNDSSLEALKTKAPALTGPTEEAEEILRSVCSQPTLSSETPLTLRRLALSEARLSLQRRRLWPQGARAPSPYVAAGEKRKEGFSRKTDQGRDAFWVRSALCVSEGTSPSPACPVPPSSSGRSLSAACSALRLSAFPNKLSTGEGGGGKEGLSSREGERERGMLFAPRKNDEKRVGAESLMIKSKEEEDEERALLTGSEGVALFSGKSSFVAIATFSGVPFSSGLATVSVGQVDLEGANREALTESALKGRVKLEVETTACK